MLPLPSLHRPHGSHSPEPGLAYQRNKDSRPALPALDSMEGPVWVSWGYNKVGLWEKTTVTAHIRIVSALSFLLLDKRGDSDLGEGPTWASSQKRHAGDNQVSDCSAVGLRPVCTLSCQDGGSHGAHESFAPSYSWC